jgi:molecular chaperone DnaJ
VESGHQLRLEGVAPPLQQGGPPGDLLVQLEVGPSPTFQREGFDLYVEVPIDMVDACLGTAVE